MVDDPASDIRLQAGPHVFVDDLEHATLDDHDRHHLERSLRLRSGDLLTASDGQGRWRGYRFGDVLQIETEVVHVAPAPWPVAVAIALTKGAKPELAVQKATELGVDRIVVFAADRSVVRWEGDKVNRGTERLRRVVREAAMQSRQVRVPSVDYVADLGDLGAEFLRADFAGDPLTDAARSIAIGPEGGWSDREQSLVTASVDLGGAVLRAETAAIAAATRMTALRLEQTNR